ncbi:HamA C-terminal domain-containing protein [Bacillus subtilis]|uniref:HamA C-terminal domain-containing protein n=1 Tax=Bacillus subtilis TaxID=1423 RepID=UPI0026747553|nr:DUF1837 domain-containing protein [Bacillus subtilis]MDO3654787.1 DUF1837 domain-containing protein [Bacillus subtilis]
MYEFNEITDEMIGNLLTHTDSLMNHIYLINQSFDLKPNKRHYATCINYVDLQEYREEFLEELVNTICEWVYSNTKAQQIIDEMVNEENRSIQNANSKLRKLSLSYFRDRDDRKLNLQGQIGELILFNFIQHYFKAVPLIRKMPITTSTGHERFGADAIHYKKENDKNIIILGESKIYTTDYRFKAAFETSITSILSTFENHRKEIGLYIYNDFLDESLEKVARAYKRGTLKNSEVHLVCVIGYNETSKLKLTSEAEIKAQIESIIIDKCKKIEKGLFEPIEEGLLERISYILFPVWELDALVKEFQDQIR